MAFTYCENCGEKIDDTNKFCPHCGHSKTGAPNAQHASQSGNAYTDGQNANAQNPYSNNQNPYGNPQNPYGNQGGYGNQNPYGQNPYGQNPYGQSPYGQNSYGNGQQPPYGNYPPYGNRPQNGQNRKPLSLVVVFSIVVMVCFNTLFGIIALMIAMKAPNEPTEELVEKKNRLAIIINVIGIVVGIAVSVIYFALILNGSIY